MHTLRTLPCGGPVLFLFLLASCDRPPADAEPMPQGPVAYTGHGALFDREGRELDLTDTVIARIQNAYTAALLDRASAGLRRDFEALSTRVRGDAPLEGPGGLVVNARLLDWLIAAARPADAERLRNLNGLLTYRIQRRFPNRAAPDSAHRLLGFAIPDDLRRRMVDAGLELGTVTQGLESGTAGEAYRALCRDNGVPDPPDWGTAQWTDRGQLDRTFIVTALPARVYTWQSTNPEGMCIALPRIDGSLIDALGIICLGKATGKACFWDNQDKTLQPDRKFRPQVGEVVPIARFAGGSDLMDNVGGVCTSCHAGENPYVIHPETPLGRPVLAGLPLDPDRWYEPIVKPGWPQNPGPSLIPLYLSGPCDACHSAGGTGGRFPQLSTRIGGYCNEVLNQAMQYTMPPNDPGSLYQDAQAVALRAACAAAAPPPGDLARFISQTAAPVTMPPGFPFGVTVTFANAGTTPWTGAHRIAVATPSAGGVPPWGAAEFPVGSAAQPLLSADRVTQAFAALRAPAQPGTYDLAFVLRDPVGRVLAAAPPTQVTVVGNTPYDNAALTIVSAPGSLRNGQGQIVTVTATNTGTTTWTTPRYSLQLSRTGRVSLPQTSTGFPGGSLASLASTTIAFMITCNGQGTGSFTVQMAETLAGRFGQRVGRTVVCQP